MTPKTTGKDEPLETDSAQPQKTARSGIRHVTPAQRAAVIIALLGDTLAKPVAEKLGDDAMAKVARSLETIQFLSKDQLIEIVDTFLSTLSRNEGAFRGGASKAKDVISNLLSRERSSAILGLEMDKETDGQPAETVWEKLANLPADVLAAYLDRLSPNLIALILKKLDPTLASDMLGQLDETKLAPVISKMILESHADPDVDEALAQMIQIEVLNANQTVSAEDDEVLDQVGTIVSLVPDRKREPALKQLKEENAEAYENLQRAVFTVDKIPELLPRNQVPLVFKELDDASQINLIVSLGKDNGPVVDFLLENISTRMADRIRSDLEIAPSLQDDEIENTLRDFLSTIMTLKRRGDIVFNEPVAEA